MVPLHPSQWAGAVIRLDSDQFCVDTRVMFGLSSAGGAYGHVADAGVEICRGRGLGPLTKWYNELRNQLKTRIRETGGLKHHKGRLLFLGQTLPSGQLEEFDDDFTFDIRDLSNVSPRSLVDRKYTYAFCDIDRITLPLGYQWAKDKDVPFCDNPTYFGFQWHISSRLVSVPLSKRLKYLKELEEWGNRPSHNTQQVSKLYGKLLHVSLVLPIGRSYLIELEKFEAELSHAAPFTKHHAPRGWHADLCWWKLTLSAPISSPIPGPATLIDIHAYSDASSGYGIGLCIQGFWRSYRLLPGWRGHQNERDIGWAEAAGFHLLVLTFADLTNAGHHYKVWGDNEGVVEGWWSGRSRNRATNLLFRRTHEILASRNFFVHTRYIPSASNPADPFSRGKIGPLKFLLPRIPIPQYLSDFIIDYDEPLSPAELALRDPHPSDGLPSRPKRSHERLEFNQWRLEEEGRLLAAFDNAW